MGRLLKEVTSRASHAFAEYFPLGYVVVSSDNDSRHPRWQKRQDPTTLNSIPANSPDIHKVVEHPLNPFNELWYKEFAADRSCTTCEGAMALASRLLHRYQASSVWKDLQTLPATLQAIIDNKGDWAPAELC